MSKETVRAKPGKRFAPIGIIFGILGLLLFAYFVRRAGVTRILDGIGRLGFGFFLIILISSVRHTVRSLAWTKCFEPPYQLRFRDAFAARLMGDALGNIVPLASAAVSEPSKAAFVRHRVPLLAGLPAIALENIFYSLSAVLLIFSGSAALLLSFPLKTPLRYATISALVVTACIVPIGYLVIKKQWRFLSKGLALLGKRRVRTTWVESGIPRARIFEDRVYGFYGRNKNRLLPIFALELVFHMAGIAEVYTVLSFISDQPPTLLMAFILESVNRVINVAFKFIPLRLGVDEGGTEMVSTVLGLTKATGVTLAIIRKGRDLFWTGVGVILMVRRGLSLKELAEKREEAVAAIADPT
ncbi:MAG TPA: lysylphosphatidylglycerol synthase transmembrane domain-containing protein [Pyrinomonadaceae bacterium]|nr:lysylphosphatidylglycerol synthase transmembrane domain-containing protein [Pyrinomonadaceae bacterium]